MNHEPHQQRGFDASPLPPDSRLRKPKHALPIGTVDCHAHIFDHFERYPLSSNRRYQPPLCTREAWFELHDCLGVTFGVQVHGTPYGFDNTITEDFVQSHPDRLRAVGSISPDSDRSLIARLDKAGFCAARLMDQFPTGATTKDLEQIANLIADFGWHIEINIAESRDWIDLEARLLACPVPLVFDHMGRVRGREGVDSAGFRTIARILERRADAWTKISSWYRLSDRPLQAYDDMEPIVKTLLRNFPEQCVWGTNWPHPGIHQHMPNDIDLVDGLSAWIEDESTRNNLFALNARRLYAF
jgi:predicted TIM-barrel fold metal-dependent hydrolase